MRVDDLSAGLRNQAFGPGEDDRAMSPSFPAFDSSARVETPDGSWISFGIIGQGPAVVLLHGLMSAAHSHFDLAEILARHFTVIVPDRRGRGASGPPAEGDALGSEADDLALLIDHCRACACIGVSLGASIVLETARRRDSALPLVIFDPPLAIGGSPSLDWLQRYRLELRSGKPEAALVTAMLGTGLGPPGMRLIPRALLRLMARRFIKADASSAPSNASLLDLMATLERDLGVVKEGAGTLERPGSLGAVLLLGSERSPRYFRQAFAVLSSTLRNAQAIVLTGLGHEAANNRDAGGSPDRVAAAIAAFLLSRIAGPTQPLLGEGVAPQSQRASADAR